MARAVPALGFRDVRNVPVWIYGLRDPRSKRIRYIGKSSAPERRLASHRSRSGAVAVRGWCRSLIAEGVQPIVVRLHKVPPGQDADRWERRFLDVYRRHGHGLLNRCL